MLALACSRREWSADEVDYSAVEVRRDKMRVVTGPVGAGRWERDATYVLVDAHNKTAEDLMVTLSGALEGGGGAAVGKLQAQSLRVPAGGVRTFALVDSEQKERAAASAEVEVVGAMKVDYQPLVTIADGHVYRDGDRVVVSGNVINTVDREGSVIVIAGFYDERGAPMKRPSTALRLAGHGKRGVQFVGPEGSRSAYLFIGELTY